MVYFDQIMHHSAGNDQFAFHTFLLALDTDLFTFTKGRAHKYGQLILIFRWRRRKSRNVTEVRRFQDDVRDTFIVHSSAQCFTSSLNI